MLAAIGAGLYRSEAEGFAAMGGQAVRIQPDPEAVRLYEGIYAGMKE
jgi:hypothetical protein